MRAIALALLLLSLLVSQIPAADRYYDITLGSDANDPCAASGTPCQTIDKLTDDINTLAACGDTYFFKAGEVWTANDASDKIALTDFNCTLGNEFIITTYGGAARAILDGGTRATSDDGMKFSNVDFINVSNIHMRDWLHNIDVRGGQDLIFDNVECSGSTSECVHIRRFSRTVAGNDSARILFTNGYVHDHNAEAFYVGTDSAQTGTAEEDHTTDITISNTHIGPGGTEVEAKAGVTNLHFLNNFLDARNPNFGGAIVINSSIKAPIVDAKAVIRGNYIRGTLGATQGYGVRCRNGCLVERNIISGSALIGVFVEDPIGDGFARIVRYNTIYNSGGACTSISGSGATVADNICWANASGNGLDPQFVDAVGEDFNFPVTSPSYQGAGAGDDRGALQAPSIPDATACEIGAVDASTFVANWSNPIHPPLSAITDGSLTIKYDAVAKTHSGGTVIQGTNQTRTAMDSAAVAEAITFDALYGAAEGTGIGSAVDGGVLLTSKSRVITAQACTNNVGAGAPTLTQLNTRTVRFRGPAGSSPFKAAENASKTIRPGGCVRAIMQWECDAASPAACPTQGYRLRDSKNGSAYGDVPDTCSTGTACLFSDHPDVANLTATAQRLLACTTFVPGAFLDNQTAVPSYALGINECVEAEYPICVAADVVVGDTFTFRIYTDAGDALGTYTQDLELVVATPPHHRQVGGVARSGGGLVQ